MKRLVVANSPRLHSFRGRNTGLHGFTSPASEIMMELEHHTKSAFARIRTRNAGRRSRAGAPTKKGDRHAHAQG